MAIFLGIIKFIAAFFAAFTSLVLTIQIINGVVNPQIVVEDGKIIDKNNNSRLIYALIASIAWALVIALP
jgi:hypothetical protein